MSYHSSDCSCSAMTKHEHLESNISQQFDLDLFRRMHTHTKNMNTKEMDFIFTYQKDIMMQQSTIDLKKYIYRIKIYVFKGLKKTPTKIEFLLFWL